MNTFLTFIFFITFSISFAQNSSQTQEVITNKSYDELNAVIYKTDTDSLTAKKYARTYILKAKLDNDHKRLISGYYALIHTTKSYDIKLTYLDSILALTTKKWDSLQPASAYVFKGSIYHEQFDFKNALNNYLLAYEYAEKSKNTGILYQVEFNIGLLKSDIGEYREALRHLKNYYAFIQSYKPVNTNNYYNPLFAISTTYRKLNLLDSAAFYNKRGKDLAHINENQFWQHQFTLNDALNNYYSGDFTAAIGRLYKVIPFYEKTKSHNDLLFIYSYLGRSYYKTGATEKGIQVLEKAKRIFEKNKVVFPEVREGFEILLTHYKNKDDYELQLKTIEHLMEFDTLLQYKFKYLTKTIVKEYDTKQLLSQKDQLISTLESQKKAYSIRNIILIVLLIISVSVLSFYSYTKNTYKKRFKKFIADHNKNNSVNKKKLSNSIDVPSEIIENIIKNLRRFEKSEAYKKPGITLDGLAKYTETNTKYLSKVINAIEEKSFRTYINHLRVQYAVKKLQNDPVFRKYTINAIAIESGFNHPETFTKAFYKYTGVYPSFFIKQLNK